MSGNHPQNHSASQAPRNDALPAPNTTQPSQSSVTSNANPAVKNDVQATAEADLDSTIAGLVHVNPKVGQILDQAPQNAMVPVALDVAEGLASALSTIDAIVKIGDLLADVSPLPPL